MEYEFPDRPFRNFEDVYQFLTRTVQKMNENNNILRNENEELKERIKELEGEKTWQ